MTKGPTQNRIFSNLELEANGFTLLTRKLSHSLDDLSDYLLKISNFSNSPPVRAHNHNSFIVHSDAHAGRDWTTVKRLFPKRHKKVTPEAIPVEELLEGAQNPETGWASLYYGNVSKLAELINASTVIEVGVAYGGHAHSILNRNSQINYIGVDPYFFGYDTEDAFCSDVERYLGLKGQNAMDELYKGVSNSFNVFGHRALLERVESLQYATKIEDNSQELVFLDDNHKYAYVAKEIETWWPKIKLGGILCGDDYWMEDVSRAVNEFVSMNNLELFFVCKNEYRTWFLQKM